MSNLDHLISKILSDCEEKSKQIIEAANQEAAAIVQKSVDAAEKEKAQIVSGAKDEAEKAAERIISGKKLEIRDENLNVKQETIDKVFDDALKKLNAMSKDEYQIFLCDNLLAIDVDGGEVILPSRYGIKDTDALRAFLKENSKAGSLTLSEDKREINGGFLLIKDGIEYNHTFETLLQYHRYELESEIIKILF